MTPDWTSLNYIISQVFITLCYVVFGSTYFRKNRKNILLSGIASNTFGGIAFFLLGGYSGMVMNFVAITRDITSSIIHKNRPKDKQSATTKLDWYLLGLWVTLLTAGSIVTANGFFSLFWYFATLLFTISIWQKNIFIYRSSGVLTSILRMIYHIFLGNIMGIVLEAILFVFIVIGFLQYVKEQRGLKNLPNPVLNQ